MKAILQSITDKSDFKIEVMESDKDHMHFLIRYIPRLSITSIVRKLKQESTIAIWQNHNFVLSKNFWGERTFWSDGYFVCSIGEASPDTIRKYIISQG
jgi:putative transposase